MRLAIFRVYDKFLVDADSPLVWLLDPALHAEALVVESGPISVRASFSERLLVGRFEVAIRVRGPGSSVLHPRLLHKGVVLAVLLAEGRRSLIGLGWLVSG